MDVAGAIFRQSVCFSSTSFSPESFPVMKNPGSVCFKPNRKSVVVKVSCDMFSDKSHLEYYNNNGTRMSVKEKEKEDIGLKKKEMKKKLKLLKGLSKNLNMFSDICFGLNPDSNGLDHQVKGQIISEATEVLLGQLQKLKEEKMESKRIKKEEKAKKKAERMMAECKDSSSSSSSESDCNNVMNMKELKTVTTSNSVQEVKEVATSCLAVVTPFQIQEVENRVMENAICKDVVSNVNVDSKKIEVCMGGKCKKSGAAMLLENFQAAVGGEAAVVGCKCMGKCKDGPNVRVRNDVDAVSNPLCIGVGLEDVESIVTNFFGGSRESCSVMVPALSGV